MMRWLWLIPLIVVVLACGGGGNPTGGGGANLTMDPAVRAAAIAKVEDRQELLLGQSLTMPQRVQQMADYLGTLPEFKAAGTTPDLCAWGRFTDGGHLVVSFNRMPDWRGTNTPEREFVPETRATSVSKGSVGRVLHSFGVGFVEGDTATVSLKNLLSRGGYQVRPSTDGDASVQTLRGVKGDGYFYFNTHGGSFEDTFVSKRFCMQTSTVRTNALDAQFDIAADLNNLNLVWMTAPNGLQDANGKAISDTRYAITAEFVNAYWRFEPNAIVHFNVCYSSYVAAPNGAQNFIAACQNQGAAVHLGWSEAVQVAGSLFSAQYFLDRLLAAEAVQPESPKQRPFHVAEILTDMTTKGHIPVAGVNFVASFKPGVTNAGLRPTIEFLTMLETVGELHLHGEFGKDTGEVFVDGTLAGNIKWGEKLITCEIPATGPGSFGNVMVKVHGKESNKRPLTLYSGSFSYTETGQGSLKVTITGQLKVRQDFAKRRQRPGGPVAIIDPIPFFAAPGSTASFTASGEHRSGQTLIEKWTGGGAMVLSNTPVTAPSAMWSSNGAYDPTTGEIYIAVVAGGPKQISGQVGNSTVMAGAFARISPLNDTTWVVAPFTEPGNPGWTFTAMTPQSPPTADLMYRPGSGQ